MVLHNNPPYLLPLLKRVQLTSPHADVKPIMSFIFAKDKLAVTELKFNS